MDQTCYMAEVVNEFQKENDSNWNKQLISQDLMSLIKSQKKQRVGELSTITLAYVFQRKGSRKAKHTKRLKVLLDSGCGATMINKEHVKDLPKQISNQNWNTKSGTFKTNGTCKVTFSLPQFHQNREITWKMHVEESNTSNNTYEIIIARDLMHEIGFKKDFHTGRKESDNT